MYACSGLLAVLFVGETNEGVVDQRIEEITAIIEKIQTELKIKITFDPIHSAHKNEFFYNKNGAQMRFRIPPGVKVPKGLTVTAELEGLDGTKEKPRYVVYCDGSKRINFGDIYRVFAHLHNYNYDSVITRRKPWRGAISEPRKRIEEFESWLTCTQSGVKGKVHDLQSGLWGYNYDRCKIRLHSESYETELNFAVEAFKCAKTIFEMEIEVTADGIAPSTTPSSFAEKYDEGSFHFQKADFLCRYFILTPAQIKKQLEIYLASHGKTMPLPAEYVKMLDLLEKPSPPPVIINDVHMDKEVV